MKKMSVRKWKQKAAEKSAVDQQTHEILQKFKMNKIGKEFGQLSGDELFKPNAPTPAPSPTSSPPPSPPPPLHDIDDDEFPPPPPPLEKTSTRKEWGEPAPIEFKYPHESTLLQTSN